MCFRIIRVQRMVTRLVALGPGGALRLSGHPSLEASRWMRIDAS
jgi:hypothetical protein